MDSSAFPKTKKTKLRNLSAVLLATALFGCGPNIVDEEMGRSEYLRSPDSFQYFSSGGYTCPTEPNVTPYEDRVFDGTQHYTVCRHPTFATKIRISGYSSTDRTVCVFPLQFLDDMRFVYKVTPNGLPVYVCYDAQSAPTKEFDFQNTVYDGLAIVDQSDQAEMSRCMMNGTACPTHSIGRFR